MDYKELNHSDLGEVFTSFYSDVNVDDNELYHHGVKGMKWGVRRYQNKDGSLTPAGKKRYKNDDSSSDEASAKTYATLQKYASSKDRSDGLGMVVGKDERITEAAKKLLPARQKYEDACTEKSRLALEMESAYEKETDRLWNEIKDPVLREAKANKFLDEKYGKQMEAQKRKEEQARKEYEAETKKVVDEYLGAFKDEPIVGLNGRRNSAAEELARQLDWGIGLGRLDPNSWSYQYYDKKQTNKKRLFKRR